MKTLKRQTKNDVIATKIKSIRNGSPIRTLDLFAGCGGLSLGFHSAGFQISASIEFDPIAAKSHARNFFGSELSVHAKAHDITEVNPESIVSEFSLGRSVSNSVDVIIGGPPCQAFARVGRAKLREVDEHPTAFKNDARGNLYLRYLSYVRELKPLALLIENVPDMMNYGGHNIAEEVCEVLDGLGYIANYTLLNSAFYGVPQMRERMFLVAYRKELECPVEFPQPTHHVELPVGYKGSRDVALKSLRDSQKLKLFEIDDNHYIPAPVASVDLPRAISARDAISDLPPITLHLEGKMKKMAQRLETITPYSSKPLNDYAKLMRGWPGFECTDGIREHVTRYLPRDFQIFRVMRPGDQYPQAHQHACRLFAERLKELEKQGTKLRAGSNAYLELKKSIVPPYDPSKFPNKWRKMEADLPSRTLLAHIGKDTYSHIHYDSDQARTISVREAARLQSFPDGFLFCGSMNAAFRQIGNAVPPLMAKSIAAVMFEAITGDRQ
jgi:DNA (cytosine-5)-methyltransferase 1